MDQPYTCVLATDLRDQSDAATRFAVWMTQVDPSSRVELLPTHVIPKHLLPHTLQPESRRDVQAHRREAVRTAMVGAGAKEPIEHAAAFEAGDPAAALADQARAVHARALIIGRRASTDASPMIALGRTARRLIRWLPTTVVVVPPHLRAGDLPDGPVVLATDLSSKSESAAAFANEFAELVGRKLAVLHVTKPPRGPSSRFGLRDLLAPQGPTVAATDLAKWADRAGLPGVETVLRHGSIVQEASAYAREVDACLLACGSRLLSAADRIFSSSVGMGLAAIALAPVAVVPPTAVG